MCDVRLIRFNKFFNLLTAIFEFFNDFDCVTSFVVGLIKFDKSLLDFAGGFIGNDWEQFVIFQSCTKSGREL